MFRSKIKLAVLILGILGFLAFGLFIDYHVPENPVSVVMFKAVYTLTPFKYSFLEYYSPLRRDVYNGDIPPGVDTFLCERLEVSDDPGEIEAIVHLYGMQTGGREGSLIQERTEKTQEKIAAEIMRQLENGGTHLAKKIVLLDEIRIRKGPAKGGLGGDGIPRSPWFKTPGEWVKWSDVNQAPIAVPYLKTWWNSGLTWEEKKKVDPFAGTNVRIGYCC
jgi:hypothetical protein